MRYFKEKDSSPVEEKVEPNVVAPLHTTAAADSDTPSAAGEVWDLRSVRDISALPPGAEIMGHFKILETSPDSIVMQFGNTAPDSDMGGLFQIAVKERDLNDSADSVEVSITTVMFSPKEDKKAFLEIQWLAHIL